MVDYRKDGWSNVAKSVVEVEDYTERESSINARGAFVSSWRWDFVCAKVAEMRLGRGRSSSKRFERNGADKLIERRNLQPLPCLLYTSRCV